MRRTDPCAAGPVAPVPRCFSLRHVGADGNEARRRTEGDLDDPLSPRQAPVAGQSLHLPDTSSAAGCTVAAHRAGG